MLFHQVVKFYSGAKIKTENNTQNKVGKQSSTKSQTVNVNMNYVNRETGWPQRNMQTERQAKFEKGKYYKLVLMDESDIWY